MRAPTIAAVLALAALASACGDDPEPPRDEPRVKLELGSPADGAVVRAETVEIRGTVKPRGATVQVLGHDVAVDGGSFRAEVPLEPGANLIDVAADAPRPPSRLRRRADRARGAGAGARRRRQRRRHGDRSSSRASA